MGVRARLIPDPPRSPSLNMAIDEMLLESQNAGGALPTLRIYFWDRPCYTIGYFQKVEKKDAPVVRRLTGGGLVRHGQDITFSFTAFHSSGLVPKDVKTSYLAVNEALRIGLKSLYPALDFADCKTVPSGRGKEAERICFDKSACYDLLLNRKKVVGASQRRIGTALLHQSSIFLEGNKGELARLIAEGFQKKMGLDFEIAPLDKEEMEKARDVEKKRYSLPDWAFLDASFLAKQSGQL